MEAKDLMIGDIVRVAKDVCLKKGTIVRVCGIDADNRFPEKGLVGSATCVAVDDEDRMSWGIWTKHLEPIRLLCDPSSCEILEKNGFVKVSGVDESIGVRYRLVVPTDFEENSFTVQINLYKEAICGVSALVKCWGWISPHNVGLNDIHLCSANYFHQLQHAMRLCGIEKEITI